VPLSTERWRPRATRFVLRIAISSSQRDPSLARPRTAFFSFRPVRAFVLAPQKHAFSNFFSKLSLMFWAAMDSNSRQVVERAQFIEGPKVAPRRYCRARALRVAFKIVTFDCECDQDRRGSPGLSDIENQVDHS